MLQTGKVLIAGGWDDTVGDSGGYELYNPLTSSFSWSPGSGPGNFAFLWYSTAPLQNGKVLFAGGRCVGSPNECTWGATTADAFLYDPSTGNAPLTVSLPHDLAKATATLLQNGQVLVAGGVNNDGTTVNISELYTY